MAFVHFSEKYVNIILFFFSLLVACLLPVICFVLLINSLPLLSSVSIPDILFTVHWIPSSDQFGLFSFICGTIIVTFCSMILAIPIGLLSALYLAEYATPTTRSIICPAFDLLAGIPSVVVGLFGVIIIVPLIRNVIAPILGSQSSGYCVLSGTLVLALMVLPIIVSLSEQMFHAVPQAMKTGSFALGATRWQTVKYVTLVVAFPGIVAVILLAFSRAIGETMAVLMVVGNVATIPSSLLDPAYPLPALIANTYGELMSVPKMNAAIMTAAIVLMGMVIILQILVQRILQRVTRTAI